MTAPKLSFSLIRSLRVLADHGPATRYSVTKSPTSENRARINTGHADRLIELGLAFESVVFTNSVGVSARGHAWLAAHEIGQVTK